MSHRPQRKEKDCLNCGTIVQGHYCQNCGQENTEPKETFWGMVTHFFYDITHFDGKFFVTLKDLFFKPGFLSAEYIRGRRVAYLHPIRMYIFTSAIFFLVFFAVQGGSDDIMKVSGDEAYTRAQQDSALRRLDEELATDSSDKKLFELRALLADTTRPFHPSDMLPYMGNFTTLSTIGSRDYRSVREYDSVQKALPASEKDGWFRRLWNRKSAELNEKYPRSISDKAFRNKMGNVFLHKLSYLLFISLPLFAGLLKLLYIRRKNFYYADHGVFTIHHYILSFILLLLVFLWNALEGATDSDIFGILIAITILAWPVYLYKAMRRFYGQGRGKTIVKFLLLNLMGAIMLVILFTALLLFSIFQL